MYDRVVDVPRLLCFYGEGEPLPHPALVAARDALNAHYGPELGEPFVTAGLCLYRDGATRSPGTATRSAAAETEDTMVAIVSLGSPRHAAAAAARRRRDDQAPARPRRPDRDGRLLPAHLGARDPQDRRSVGPRISVQFRPRGVR